MLKMSQLRLYINENEFIKIIYLCRPRHHTKPNAVVLYLYASGPIIITNEDIKIEEVRLLS